jgi:hypothetical protein
LAQLLPAPAFWFTRYSGRNNSLSGDARTSPIVPGIEVEMNRAGLVVKHVDAAELRIVAAAALAIAADAVLVAHNLPKLAAHLVTALARPRV